MILTVFLVSLFGAMALGIPIAFALIISGVCLMYQLDAFNTQIIVQNIMGGADSFPMMAIPFFILAGELMNAGGISKRIIEFALAYVGHIRGGIGYVAILGSVIFAGLSGSAVADTAALGAILIPMMVRSGYDRNRSAGLIAAGGIIAPIIPPSIPMIILGVTGGLSITKLFLSGIVPGLMLGLALAICWWWITRKEDLKTEPRKSFKEIWIATRKASWSLVLPLLIIFGLRGGVFTPTEAGVVAVFYALFVGMFVYRELKIKHLSRLLLVSAKTTSVVMFLVAAAMVSAYFITVANIPGEVAELLEPFKGHPTLMLMMINVIILIVGTVMDLTPTILILTPVLLPIAIETGIDPIVFGLIFVLNNCIGLLTPPVGTVLNVACGVARIGMNDIMKGIKPFLIIEVAVLILLTLFPSLITVPLKWLS